MQYSQMIYIRNNKSYTYLSIFLQINFGGLNEMGADGFSIKDRVTVVSRQITTHSWSWLQLHN